MQLRPAPGAARPAPRAHARRCAAPRPGTVRHRGTPLTRASASPAAAASVGFAPPPDAATGTSHTSHTSSPTSSSKSWWQAALGWWDVGVSESDKQRQPGKLADSLSMAWQLIAQERRLIAAACMLMVAASACELMIPYYTSKIIFAITQHVPQEVFRQHLVSYAAFALGFALFAAGRGSLFSILNNKLSRALRYRLFGVLLREQTSFHDVNEPGQLTSRLTSDCYAITRCISTNVNIAMRNLLQVIGGGAILVCLSPGLSGLCLAIFTALWGFTILYGSYSRHSQRVVQDVLANSTATAEEALNAVRIVRTFGTEQLEQDRYKTWLDKLYDVGMRQSAAWGLYLVAGTTAHHASLALSLLLGGSMVYAGAITAEQLTSFMFYVQLVTASSLAVCDQYGAIMEAIGASERVLAHLNDPPAPQIAAGFRPQGQLSGEVWMRGVAYTYPNRPDTAALSGVDLWLQPGKMTALVGLSGSGKSTLVALLQRLYDPTEGQVLIDGVDLSLLDAPWYRSRLGVVSQEPRLFSLSVRDNICYGCPFTPTHAEVEEAARAANAHDFITALPGGYSELVTDKLLSGGQRQRIALARALVRKPALLILDEATSALDAESEALVQQALDRAMKPPEGSGSQPRTVLVIAHRLSTVRNAHNIVVLDKGKVAEQGTHAELVSQRGIYWGLVRRQRDGLSPTDRDLSPREKDPPMLSSRDWDYGAESSMSNRDATSASNMPLRSGSPLPGVVEGSAAGGDSPRGLNSSPSPAQVAAAATPPVSAAASAASLASASVGNSFALSVDEDDDEGAGGGQAGLQAAAAASTAAQTQQQEVQQHIGQQQQQQQLGHQDAFMRAQRGQQAPKQQQQQQRGAGNATAVPASSRRSSSNGARPASSSSNSTAASHADGNGAQPAPASNGKAANDIVPLTSSKAPAGERSSSSSKVQQQAAQQQ